jgi:hypothetical protein
MVRGGALCKRSRPHSRLLRSATPGRCRRNFTSENNDYQKLFEAIALALRGLRHAAFSVSCRAPRISSAMDLRRAMAAAV